MDTETPRRIPSPLAGEGRERGRKGQGDRLQDRLRLGQHLIVPEPDHPVAATVQPAAPFLIICNLRGVLAAVELDDQPRAVRDEVDDERSNRLLAAESLASKTVGTEVPERSSTSDISRRSWRAKRGT